MKRVFVVFREFSENGTDFRQVYGLEVFTTVKRAKEFALQYVGRFGNELVSEENDCFEFAYRMTYKSDINTYIRYTVVGRNTNNNY